MAARQLKEAIAQSAQSNPSESVAGVAAKAKEAATVSVAVFARLKPTEKGESRGEIKVRRQEKGSGKIVAVRNLEFGLENVFEEGESQGVIYEVAGKERVNDVLGGRNTTILAYGQTGSGKTHTMFGPQAVLDNFMGCDAGARGIVPRSCLHIFEALAAESSGRKVRCTYIEVYNDRLNDLLGGGTDLKMLESSDGVAIAGVQEEEVGTTQEVMMPRPHLLHSARLQPKRAPSSLSRRAASCAAKVMDLLARGNGRRVVAAMKMNARSSRGHAILSVQARGSRM